MKTGVKEPSRQVLFLRAAAMFRKTQICIFSFFMFSAFERSMCRDSAIDFPQAQKVEKNKIMMNAKQVHEG